MIEEKFMTPWERARKLINEGWYQVSRRFCTLARLPEGKTGKEAICEARIKSLKGVNLDYWVPEIKKWADVIGEASAADGFMRGYAKDYGLTLELDQITFDAYRKLGGGTRPQAGLPSVRSLIE